MPVIQGVLETALCTRDLERSERFYGDVLGFRTMAADARFRALAIAPGQVLLLFLEGASTQPMRIEGGVIPPHDGRGEMHVAFSIPREELDPWRERLRRSGVAIESEVRWPADGVSLYFRDPDRHLVELATPGIWPVY